MRPIFIIGNPRSGTTLLRLILDAHKEIIVPPECGFMIWWHKKYKDWSEKDGADKHRLKEFLDDLKQSRKIETWGVDWEQSLAFFLERQPKSYAELVRAVYEYYSLEVSGEVLRWGDKNNFHIQHIPIINQIFPEAQFLFIVRDGRDVACSYLELMKRELKSKYAPNLPESITAIAREWRNNNRKALEDFNRLVEKNTKVQLIRYEDLVNKPGESIQNVCNFLHIHFDTRMLQFFQHQSVKEPKEFLQWKERTVQPITNKRIGRYKKELSPTQIKKFEEVAGDLLRYFGYKDLMVSS